MIDQQPYTSAEANKRFYARINAYDGSKYYAWTQMTPFMGSMQVLDGGLAGTVSSNPAYDPNGQKYKIGQIVRIQRGYMDPTYDWVYVIVGAGVFDDDDAIWLNNTTQYLDVVLDEAATTQLPFTIDYTSYDTQYNQNGDITARGTTNSTTPVHMMRGILPANGIVGAKHVSINNVDNIQHGVTVQILDNATIVKIIHVVLAINASLHFDYKTGEWYTLPQAALPVLQGSTGPIGFSGQNIPGLDGEDGMEGMPIPGPIGDTGSIGPTGASIPGLDGDEGEMGFGIQGLQGIQGIAGPMSVGMPGLDGDEGPEGMSVPGNPGVGIQGPTGASIPGLDGDDGFEPCPIPGERGDTGPAGQNIPGLDGEDGTDGMPIPGPVGRTGDIGPTGISIPGLDGDEGEMGLVVPGRDGAKGDTGSIGLTGLCVPGLDGDEGEMGLVIPGKDGNNGSEGISGQPGPPGLDADIVNNETDYGYQPIGPLVAKLVSNAVQSFTSGSGAAVIWTTKVFDTAGYVDLVSHSTRLTVASPGLYEIFSKISITVADKTVITLQLRVNGGSGNPVVTLDVPYTGLNTAEAFPTPSVHTIMLLNTNDYIEVFAAQENVSGSSRNLNNNDAYNEFWVRKLSDRF